MRARPDASSPSNNEAVHPMGLFKKKQSIDPVEFLVLRNELVELKERLDASEQAKASLEDRLSSLAATTMVLPSAAAPEC